VSCISDYGFIAERRQLSIPLNLCAAASFGDYQREIVVLARNCAGSLTLGGLDWDGSF
jgi:hypothetical protein